MLNVACTCVSGSGGNGIGKLVKYVKLPVINVYTDGLNLTASPLGSKSLKRNVSLIRKLTLCELMTGPRLKYLVGCVFVKQHLNRASRVAGAAEIIGC